METYLHIMVKGLRACAVHVFTVHCRFAALSPILREQFGDLINSLVDWLVDPCLTFVHKQVKVKNMYTYMYSRAWIFKNLHVHIIFLAILI